MTDDTLDALTDSALDAAHSVMTVYMVAESPDGPVLSYSNDYPDDDTEVWLENKPGEKTQMGDLYARYGDDLIAYAEPEEASVAAALTGHAEIIDTAEPAARGIGDLLDGLRPPAPPEPAITAAMGMTALDQIEAFLTETEDLLGITAALNGPGAVPRPVQRMAVGENPEAQAQVIAAFETHYTPDVGEFIDTVLGPRPPDDTPDHDAEAWDALAQEARLWHSRKVAAEAAVAASLRQKGTEG